MFKLFKRTARTPKVELEVPPIKKEYPRLSVYSYGSSVPITKQVAPDFESKVIDVKRESTYTTVYFEEGTIEVPNDKIIVVRRYNKNESE